MKSNGFKRREVPPERAFTICGFSQTTASRPAVSVEWLRRRLTVVSSPPKAMAIVRMHSHGWMAIACVGVWLAMVEPSSPAQIKGSLTGPEVREAIELGIAGDVAPFPMYPANSGERALSAGVRPPALVYTPFVRVALQARAAHNRGVVLNPSEVHPAALEPVAYVGFTIRACCGEGAERYSDGTLTIHAVFDSQAVRNAATAARALQDKKARPLWIQAGTAPLRELGIDPPDNFEAVAAFPVEVVATAKEFRVARVAPDGTAGVFGFLRPVRGDTRDWR